MTTQHHPAPAGTRRRGHDAESVLAAAVTVFNRRGYDATSMADLAGELGVTKAAIYHHVSGKQELLRRSLDRALDGLFAVTTEPGARDGDPAAALEYVLRRAVAVLIDQLPHVTLLLRLRGNTAVERAALARRRAFDTFVAGLVAAARDAGVVRGDVEAGLAGRLLFGMVNSISEWYRPGAGGDAALADAVAGIALDGLRARP